MNLKTVLHERKKFLYEHRKTLKHIFHKQPVKFQNIAWLIIWATPKRKGSSNFFLNTN